MPKVKVNMNDRVKVKLTEHGLCILKRQHDELNKKIESAGGVVRGWELKLDRDGYYEDSLWGIMQTFGEHIGMGMKQPFEVEIIIL